MRGFNMVEAGLWHSKSFRALEHSNERLLYLYLKTSPHQNSSGCCRLPAGYACDDLQWTHADYAAALEALVKGGLVLHDTDSDEIFVMDWFGVNVPQNPKHKQGTDKFIAKIQSDRLRQAASEACQFAYDEIVRRAAENVGLRRGPEQRSMLLPVGGSKGRAA